MDNSSNDLMMQRQKKVIEFIKKKKDWAVYILLAIVVYIAAWIRTRNLPGLRDITTGGWTLGPDLDPFLFLRWARYIVENGSLFKIDPLRYIPLGFDTGLEYPLLAHSIALFHKVAVLFGSTSVDQSAVLFPVFMFIITVIAFFLMTREALMPLLDKKQADYAALVSSLFLSIIPSFIPRAIAGIPEKEGTAFFFFFMAFYFFLLGWKQDKLKKQISLSMIGGIFAGLMALTWGGYGYILITLSLTILILFMFNQINLNRTLSYYSFILPIYILLIIFFSRIRSIGSLLSIDWLITLFVSLILIVDYVLHKKLSKYIPSRLKKYPRITSIIYSVILSLLGGTIIFGFGFILSIFSRFKDIFRPNPGRLIQTVAENREPFFTEWAYNFGPYIKAIPILMLTVLIGSTIAFYKMFKGFFQNKNKLLILSSLWAFFFLAIILSRYDSNSIFNGSNFISILFYAAGLLAILFTTIYFFLKKDINPAVNFSIGALFSLVFLAVALQSARSSVRLTLVLVPPASIFVGYLFIISMKKIISHIKNKNIFNFRALLYTLIILAMIIAGYYHFNSAVALSSNYVPNAYTQQWQRAMAWVRENTPDNAVFAHWWDYGYWVQSIGERATVLDGANYIGYWNYLMGRHGLTETDTSKTLEFFYAHNVTHFLIDSTDIGKYSAFSTIGSDPSYDRRSWIPTLLRDNSQTTERKNTTLFVYPGGTSLDKDITYNLNGTELFLPEGKAYLAAAVVVVDNEDESIDDVFGVYYLQEKTYQIPLRYYWDEKIGFVDMGRGINAGVFLFPRVSVNSQGGANVEPRGAMLYLSPKTVMTNLARLYLYGEINNNFRLAHSEPDAIVQLLRSQNVSVGDFVYFNEFRGPIKIWELNYPQNIQFKEEYLQTEYPDDLLFA